MVIDETELEGLTEDQRDAYIALKEGRNVFLSGNAGTGKSYVLNRFIDEISMCRIDLFDYVMRMISDAQVSSGRKQACSSVISSSFPRSSRKMTVRSS